MDQSAVVVPATAISAALSADGGTCLVAVAGVVDVMCTASNNRNDFLQTSATAGQAQLVTPPAVPVQGAILGKVLKPNVAGPGGLARILLRSG